MQKSKQKNIKSYFTKCLALITAKRAFFLVPRVSFVKIFTKPNLVNAGFTLIEMIIAVSIFTVVVFVAVGALMSITDANRKVNTIRTTIDNLNFAMESMSRDIRTGTDYESENDGKKIKFTNQKGEEVQYRWNDSLKSIQVKVDSVPGGFKNITSPKITVESMRFYVAGTSVGNGQPRVLIVIKGTAGLKDDTKTQFSLQTTISQRGLNK